MSIIFDQLINKRRLHSVPLKLVANVASERAQDYFPIATEAPGGGKFFPHELFKNFCFSSQFAKRMLQGK
jgi:hypothetical protein